MAHDDQRRAFDRFYRATEGRAIREHGSGLGLAIVKDLVQAHGGQVGVISQPGAGSTFWFTLRLADERPAGAEAPVARAADGSNGRSKQRPYMPPRRGAACCARPPSAQNGSSRPSHIAAR